MMLIRPLPLSPPDPSEPIYGFFMFELKAPDTSSEKGRPQVLSGMMISDAAFAHLKTLFLSLRSQYEIDNGREGMDESVVMYGLLLQGSVLTFYIMTDILEGNSQKFVSLHSLLVSSCSVTTTY